METVHSDREEIKKMKSDYDQMKAKKRGYNAPPEQNSSVVASSSQFVRETSVTGVFTET